MKKRIWELDALRGLGLLAVIAIHLTYDLIYLFQVWQPKNTALFDFGQDWCGVLFLLISGICVTIGSRPIKRGITVLLCGMVITAVTTGMYLLDFAGKEIIIYFGVLHCLGLCMLLWPLFRKWPVWLLAVMGAVIAGFGYWAVRNLTVPFPWLIPLGIPTPRFFTSDYFPLMPNLGYFLLGASLGKTIYKSKQSLLPQVNARNPAIRFLSFCGRQSLAIYMLHQPILAGLIALALLLLGGSL